MIKYLLGTWNKALDLYYAIKRFVIYDILYFPRKVKWFIERGKNGFAENDVWGFDQYLAKVISGGIKHLQKDMQGAPTGLTEKQWNKILDEIQLGFTEYLNQPEYQAKLVNEIWPDEDELISVDKKKMTKYNREMNKLNMRINKNLSRSFELLDIYFRNLWD